MAFVLQGRCDECNRLDRLSMVGTLADHQWKCDGCEYEVRRIQS